MKHIPFFSYIVLTLLLLASCTGRKSRMESVLAELQAANSRGVVFTSDF